MFCDASVDMAMPVRPLDVGVKDNRSIDQVYKFNILSFSIVKQFRFLSYIVCSLYASLRLQVLLVVSAVGGLKVCLVSRLSLSSVIFIFRFRFRIVSW